MDVITQMLGVGMSECKLRDAARSVVAAEMVLEHEAVSFAKAFGLKEMTQVIMSAIGPRASETLIRLESALLRLYKRRNDFMAEISEDEFLQIAAATVERQALQNPEIGIPVDPDVADHMGAFEEAAISTQDLDDFFPEGEVHRG